MEDIRMSAHSITGVEGLPGYSISFTWKYWVLTLIQQNAQLWLPQKMENGLLLLGSSEIHQLYQLQRFFITQSKLSPDYLTERVIDEMETLVHRKRPYPQKEDFQEVCPPSLLGSTERPNWSKMERRQKELSPSNFWIQTASFL